MEKKKLSSKLSGMKFMQRKDETNTRKKLEAERERSMRESQWVATGLGTETCIIQDDNRGIPKFSTGRRSFGSFNPKMEKLVKDITEEVLGEAEKGEDISDQQMAKALKKEYTGLPGKGRPKRKNKDKSSSSRSAKQARTGGKGGGDSDVKARAAAFLKSLAPPSSRTFQKPVDPPV